MYNSSPCRGMTNQVHISRTLDVVVALVAMLNLFRNLIKRKFLIKDAHYMLYVTQIGKIISVFSVF